MSTIRKNKQTIILLAFVLPALLFYAVFTIAPAFGGVWYSLTNWNGLNPTYEMVGFANYAEALTNDPSFIKSVGFTFKYVIFMVILQNAIALTLAVFIESRKRSKVLFRTVFFMPNMLSLIIGGFMWVFIFTKVLPILAEQTGIQQLDQSWIGDPAYSFYAIIILSLWGGVGYQMVIYIAALQGVPASLREAAAIDGASSLQAFRYVTLPMIYPAITIGIFLTLSSSFKVFDAVFALTGGGPGRSTQVIALNIVDEAFRFNQRYGYASAKAIILFVIVLILTIIQLWVMKKREVEA
ncbi:raffinose/stachyose/melibiose transport system permease protein [Paenibacillus endophyticus]|uniref:Raffinose/stachyose/melibiose transport system permease protein n=1 Tax=Paenibacillus endophyticus TaxID=1294268 RepID=A0A7W5C8M2_9BACL|nr:sugar ABC transporter permease [Paenibacillus endophyticus]MBB3153137.1 raffinose/stachyose/melibiose transport system permease protein [Paenibacillus endophyticus]